MAVWKGHDVTAQTCADLLHTRRERYGKLWVAGDPSGFNRGLTDGQSVFGELHARYGFHVTAPPALRQVGDRIRLARDFMAERELGQKRRGRFAYQADLENLARDLEEAAWPTDADGRVTRETDLAHTAGALTYRVAYSCHGGTPVLPPIPSRRGGRPPRASLLRKDF